MKKLKSFLLIVLCMVFAVCLASCGGEASQSGTDEQGTSGQNEPVGTDEKETNGQKDERTDEEADRAIENALSVILTKDVTIRLQKMSNMFSSTLYRPHTVEEQDLSTVKEEIANLFSHKEVADLSAEECEMRMMHSIPLVGGGGIWITINENNDDNHMTIRYYDKYLGVVYRGMKRYYAVSEEGEQYANALMERVKE